MNKGTLALALLVAAARAQHEDHDHADHDHGDHGGGGEGLSDGQVWAASLVSVFLISLLSLLGIVLLAGRKPGQQLRLPSWLIAFAAGTLIGDSLVHLFPQLFSQLQLAGKFVVHAHGVGGEDDHGDHDEEEDPGQTMNGVLVYICMLVIALYAIDFGVGQFLGGHSHGGHSHGGHEHGDGRSRKLEVMDDDAAEKDPASDDAEPQIESYAVVNLIGDFFHNIVDGLAIGIAFSLDWSDGVAASLAIMIHEIAQELGDFSILVKGGFTVRQALGVNFLTALSSLIGAIAGAAAGTQASEDSYWLTATVIGSFLYIGLVSLLPIIQNEMKSVKDLTATVVAFTTAVFMMWAIVEIEHALEGE